MKIHPVVHMTWVSAVIAWLMRMEFISDTIEKFYDRTAWLRDLLHWGDKKKKRRK